MNGWIVLKECPAFTSYGWRGWVIDQWAGGVNVLWSDGWPAMEFGAVTELAARAAAYEEARS